MDIPFNKPYMTGQEIEYIRQAHANRHLSGDGPFTRKCHAWLEAQTGCRKALLTHSGTAALEMAALLIEIQPGDEVILPSHTFVSTANAFVLRGAVPVFVDIRPDTLNLDETKIEAAITPRTKAIVAVHYAGVGCEMKAILALAKKHHLYVIEDAAQAIDSKYQGRSLGSFGHLAALSFHETKNLISGEGGALLINDPRFVLRAEILREKGTNRSQFFRGEVEKYTWMDVGSSYLPSELIAAFLWAQMGAADDIFRKRKAIWERYHLALEPLEKIGKIRRPVIPPQCDYNYHLYYLLLPDAKCRPPFLKQVRSLGIDAVFHYIPLHSSPMGKKVGRVSGHLEWTEKLSQRLVRLPFWIGLSDEEIKYICDNTIQTILKQIPEAIPLHP